MSTAAQHVVIAGAGVIGLAAALELALAGYRVTVVERGRAMEQASWAAAGMLAVDDPENAPELLPLSRLSRALYPEFLARVEALSGLPVPLRTSQTLQGRPVGSATGSESGSASEPPLELPDLRTEQYTFTLLEEAGLDPRDLCAALPRAAIAAGVVLREGRAVLGVTRGADGLRVELDGGERLIADQFILATGAWSGQMRLPGAAALPVAPRKGQMIEVTLDELGGSNRPVLPVVVRTPELYLVPRGDGRVVIGATVEHAGFDRSIDEAAGQRLWQAAGALWPPILEGRITTRWTGLRPGYAQGVRDALPVIGEFEGEPGMWAATGHFRNGILLAPATGRVLRELLDGETPSVELEAFSPRRFAGVASAAAR